MRQGSMMTEADLIERYLQSAQVMDSNFQVWLSITFALLVATYLANKKIPPALQWIALVLYGAVSTLFTIRHVIVGETLASLSAQIVEMQSSTSVATSNENSLLGILYILILVGGTLATTVFVILHNRGRNDVDA
jgi:hypothetical protein